MKAPARRTTTTTTNTIYKSQYPHIYQIIKTHKDDLEYAESHKINIKNINHTFLHETLNSLTKRLKYYNDMLENVSKQKHYRSYVRFCIIRQDLHKSFNPYVSFVDNYLKSISQGAETHSHPHPHPHPESKTIMQEIIKSMVWIYKYKVHFRENPTQRGPYYQELMSVFSYE